MEYSFNLILALLFGLFLKIYDDIIDNKLNINIFYIDILKYFLITLFSLVFYNSIVFSIIYFEMALLSFLMDKYYISKILNSNDIIEQKVYTVMNDNIWIYSFILSGVAILYHLYCFLQTNKLNEINLLSIKNITFYINIIINFFIVTLDIYFTPENSSNKKLLARCFVFLLLSIFVYLMTFYSEFIYEGNYGIMLMNIGFLIGSICFLTLDKYKYIDSLKTN